ncbi:MAG: hypothetical protein ABII64_02080 [Elusimicrobiota bacterium]
MRGSEMGSMDLKNILATLQAMAEGEIAVCNLYRACAERWPEDRDILDTLIDDELKHSAYLKKIYEMVEKNPGKYEVGRSFNPVGVRTFISYVNQNTAKVKNGGLPRERMMNIALDIENSLLEQKFSELLKTGDIEFATLAKEIDSETLNHRKKIQERIAKSR